MQKSELDQILKDLWLCKLPSTEDTKTLLRVGSELLSKEKNVLKINSPISVCGDIHGQFYDLIELFSVGGRPPEQNFLFLGDYVDRGFYSSETFLLLLALKVRYPTKMYLIRGNHETRQITKDYGFCDEVKRKFNDDTVYECFIEAFNALPLAAVIDEKIFCVHGGLSKDLVSLKQIDEIERFVEPPDDGLFSDLLWSDPDDSITGYQESVRGAGYIFGADATEKFLKDNNLEFMCRAHQVAQEGYMSWFGGKCFTVWSAPNYCYRGGNLASVYEVNSCSNTKFKIFHEAPASARGMQPEQCLPQYFL